MEKTGELRKVLVICGPTATGKTAFGLRLARKLSGELISVDSRQVYKGMDLGTGKDVENGEWKGGGDGHWEIGSITIWLLDVARPDQEFSVAQYRLLARRKIGEIWTRKKLPIVVGGSGFYLKALFEEAETFNIAQDWVLREKLAKLTTKELFKQLSILEPDKAAGMNASDKVNPRRLTRAIEIALSRHSLVGIKKKALVSDTLFIGLTAALPQLYRRIDKRVEQRLEMGAENEVRRLIQSGYSWDLPSMSGLGYREWKSYFEKRLTLEGVISRWKYDEHAYARRQMTWFKKTFSQAQGKANQQAVWFDISDQKWENKAEKLILDWYCQQKYASKN